MHHIYECTGTTYALRESLWSLHIYEYVKKWTACSRWGTLAPTLFPPAVHVQRVATPEKHFWWAQKKDKRTLPKIIIGTEVFIKNNQLQQYLASFFMVYYTRSQQTQEQHESFLPFRAGCVRLDQQILRIVSYRIASHTLLARVYLLSARVQNRSARSTYNNQLHKATAASPHFHGQYAPREAAHVGSSYPHKSLSIYCYSCQHTSHAARSLFQLQLPWGSGPKHFFPFLREGKMWWPLTHPTGGYSSSTYIIQVNERTYY